MEIIEFGFATPAGKPKRFATALEAEKMARRQALREKSHVNVFRFNGRFDVVHLLTINHEGQSDLTWEGSRFL